MNTPDFARIVEDAIEAADPPVANTGVGVAILQNGRMVYAGGFGFRNRATGTLVNEHTLFPIGSATKAFTSTLLSIFAEDKVLSLDRPICQFVPSFKMSDPLASGEATLIDLLCHRTGLAPHDCLWYLGPFARAELFYRLRDLPFAVPFRAKFIYNNLLYMVAGHLLEILTGESYEDIIRSRILGPLGMTETTLSFADYLQSSNRVLGYIGEAPLALKDFTNIGPAGEINSSALDMAKWVELLLRRGMTGNGKVVIGEGALGLTYHPFSDPGDGTMYGLGWNVGKLTIKTPNGPRQKRLVFHTGDPQGGSAYVSFMPDDGMGVVVLTNQHCTNQMLRNKWPDKIATAVYDHLLTNSLSNTVELPSCAPMGALSLSAEPPSPVAKGVAMALAPPAIAKFTGMFSNPGYGDLVVSLNGTILSISYYGSSWQLDQFGDTTFLFTVGAFGTFFPVLVEYYRDNDGAIAGLSAQLVQRPLLMMIPFAKR
ncbi:serine hydrolase [Bradyrhizobium diazoefficiens]|nr:serine hydrolase [Bradyrhizobium diazoefficiens]MBR0701540.1 serine hydrolase [Bradyrhizobium diazoefficiens]MBR0769965.1 serine hydrolase [Bradyrhizobium diazoefficiens]